MILKSLIYFDSSLKESAQEWARQLSLDCIDGSLVSMSIKAQQAFIREQLTGKEDGFALVLSEDGLALQAIDLHGKNISIRADFHGGTATYRRRQGGGRSQMIAKAVGIKKGVFLNVLDATAGLGKDAFVLTSLGCRMTLLEREPIVYALLEDAMKRARQFAVSKDSTLLEILDRMFLVNMDALDYMNKHPTVERPDVVYLDPMFPPRAKSAQVKKEMQVLQCLLDEDKDVDALLEFALRFARRRVVVKRPRNGVVLGGLTPSYSLKGKRNRYDVCLL